MAADNFAKEFIAQAIFRMGENTPRIEKCLGQLHEDEVWKRPNDASNSVGNLVLHLCGNITQYIISALGNAPDIRERDTEFAAKGGHTKAELFAQLSATVAQAVGVLRETDEGQLLKVYSVQGFSLTGIGIILHVVEHYSYHTGQIAFWVKLLKDTDLGFYANANLNIKNNS
jgi:uncharacterized damage-inducible protein DinB